MKRPDGVRPPSGVRSAPARPASPPPAQSRPSGDDEHPTEPIRLTTPASLRLPSAPRSAAGKLQAERMKAEKAAEAGRPAKAAPAKVAPAKLAPEKATSEKAVPARAEPATAESERTPPGTAAEPRRTPLSRLRGLPLPGSEGHALAKAARERRRFERGEVRRFTKRARRRRTIALVTAGSLVVLALVVAVAAYSPLMAVKTIEITGTQRVSAEDIQNSLADQVGVPLTLVDRAAVGRVLGSYPLVRSYSVQTRPPSTLIVSVVERTPVGVIADGAEFDLVDPAGVVIETAPAAQEGYPLLSTPTGSASGAAFRATARVLLTLPESLESQVASAAATTGDDVSLTLADGAVVFWGGSDDSALKAVVLEKLMAATDPAAVASYDVSSPEAAVVARR
ncbi:MULTISPECIES: FtsQ-type POTRA domain-containing protein [unclassified Rathayibacter]|uniref:FtsQ-type POTRA domain-containing protein n=1 Tax=unclassified Rathayibacter TaxID=2609250 RepID=UPI001FB1DF3D|nr:MULTISPECIES: FtsQ-type POTRA domain-containing protein [unclassified Rathayibacter]MCJ1674220.1 FtsQ-type POTRA domain-containing protein [Rathayibacter sp. VKM Ac-2929]MCJ1684501.1 FtsQ-type POTRA domain-containing protein [Rathayibacter sp. VKM Ac-2928]